MKFRFSAATAVVALGGQLAAASKAYVYTIDPVVQPERVDQRLLSATAARCVIAQRARALEYHSNDLLGWSGDEVIAAINDFGVSTPLSDSSAFGRATVLLQTVDDDAAPSLPKNHRVFSLDPPPSAAAGRDLLIDVAKQSDHFFLGHLSKSQAVKTLQSSPKKNSNGDIFYIASNLDDLKSTINGCVAEKKHVTLVVLPRDTGDSYGEYHWGTYQMPSTHPALHKRAGGEHASQEQPSLPTNSSYNGTLRGILPACFTTQSSCEAATQNCTGHGSCIKKYTDNSHPSDESPFKNCYACQCSITVSENANGRKKTTYWGGPACQKRDVSVSFWLLVLFTVGMVFLISFAVGSIWSMGDQDLPSVIGAGVSGPARKS